LPVTTTVTALRGSATVGDYVRTVSAASGELVDLAVVAVGAGGEVAADADLDAALGASAADVVAAYQLTGKPGQVAHVVAKVGERSVRVAFIGVGSRSSADLRRAGGELGRLLRPGDVAVAPVPVGSQAADSQFVAPDDQVRAFAQGILLGSYQYTEKSAAEQPGAQVRLLLPTDGAVLSGAKPDAGDVRPGAERDAAAATTGSAGAAAVDEAAVIAGAVALTRDLSNTPSLRKCPQWLAEAAATVAQSADAGLSLRVWNEQELADAGFLGMIAVGSGSDRPPRLIELSYAPPGARRHVVLVGKGITFDSGGLSLKPNDAMKAMKTDMAGGAAVIAVMSALARLGVSHRVTGLVAAAENMPSGAAYRPGDVITQFGGRTVEVLNTDAEGRLVLADAMAYADSKLAPDVIIDLATLTGAARVALGGVQAALYSTSEELADALLAAGEASGDRLWRMPLVDEYAAALDSPVADITHISREEGQPGSILAALFLRGFAGSRPWAHLDIAGAARSGADDGEITAGATGFGTRLLLAWLTA
jgi:leucyl aminopeptidase